MGSSGPQSPPCSPEAGHRASGPQEHVWNQSSGFRHGLLTARCKRCPVLLVMPCGFSDLLHPFAVEGSNKALMPCSMYRGTTAVYSGLIMFSGFLFHSFRSFLKYYFGFCDFC